MQCLKKKENLFYEFMHLTLCNDIIDECKHRYVQTVHVSVLDAYTNAYTKMEVLIFIFLSDTLTKTVNTMMKNKRHKRSYSLMYNYFVFNCAYIYNKINLGNKYRSTTSANIKLRVCKNFCQFSTLFNG